MLPGDCQFPDLSVPCSTLPVEATEITIKEFALEITNQDLDKARTFTAQALGAMNMSKTEVSFANMQSVKNKIQDIATEARTHVDKGE